MGEVKAATGGIMRFLGWTILFTALACGLSVVGYWISAELSKPAGKAGVIIQNNDPNNQITAQQQYGMYLNQIQGYQATIKEAVDPTEIAANEQACRTVVGQYDALAVGTTTKDWRPPQDPVSIPMSDCNK